MLEYCIQFIFSRLLLMQIPEWKDCLQHYSLKLCAKGHGDIIPFLRFYFIFVLLAEECLSVCLSVYKIQRANSIQVFDSEQEPWIWNKCSADAKSQRVPQTNRSLIATSYRLKRYNQSPRNVNQTNKLFDLLSNFVLRCVPVLKRSTALAMERFCRLTRRMWKIQL